MEGCWCMGVGYLCHPRPAKPLRPVKAVKTATIRTNSYKMVGKPPVAKQLMHFAIALLTVVETKSQRQCPQNHLLKLLLYEHTVLCPNTTEKSEIESRIS